MDWFLILWAVVCVVVVLGMSYWVTRFLGGRGLLRGDLAGGKRGRIRILEQQSLGREEKLVVAQVEEHCYLLGVTANQITLLSELPWDPEQGTQEGDLEPKENKKPAFREAFFDALRQKTRR